MALPLSVLDWLMGYVKQTGLVTGHPLFKRSIGANLELWPLVEQPQPNQIAFFLGNLLYIPAPTAFVVPAAKAQFAGVLAGQYNWMPFGPPPFPTCTLEIDLSDPIGLRIVYPASNNPAVVPADLSGPNPQPYQGEAVIDFTDEVNSWNCQLVLWDSIVLNAELAVSGLQQELR